MNFFACLIISLALLSGCSIKQEVNPYQAENHSKVCIIEDITVREGFLDTFQSTLGKMGYEVIILPQGSSISDCEVVSTYMGKWSWDLAIYLSYATIKVYKNGKLVGDVLYDSRSGGANFDKFVKGDEKIRELVMSLFPPAPKLN